MIGGDFMTIKSSMSSKRDTKTGSYLVMRIIVSKAPCPRCGGAGTFKDGSVCYYCNGKGTV